MKNSLVYIVALLCLSCSSLWAQTYTEETVIDTNISIGGAISAPIEEDVNEAFSYVEEMPVFKEGSIQAYIEKHYVISKTIQKEGQPGNIYVGFIIEKDGTLSEVKI